MRAVVVLFFITLFSAAASEHTLKEKIEAMRQPEVAWRKIPWRTCLLEGAAASRAESKPMILWVFIDLPVDDKRC